MLRMAMENMTDSTLTSQSTPSPSPIDLTAAAGNQTKFFIMYVVALGIGAIGAILAAWFTVQLYRAGNRYQDLVKAEALARIEEAKGGAANALRDAGLANKSAGEANERASNAAKEGKRIEVEANKKIEEARAQAQSDIAAARVRQDEIALELRSKAKELADAQREAAEAQRRLAEKTEEIRLRQLPRKLTPEQQQTLLEMLRDAPKGEVNVLCQEAGTEPCEFAAQIVGVLNAAGWHAALNDAIQGGQPAGLTLWVHNLEPPLERGIALQRALASIGFSAPAETIPNVPEGSLILFVNVKP